MQRTLFYIPHSLLDIPIFGIGWALGLLVIAFATWAAITVRNPQRTFSKELGQSGIVWLVATVVIVFVIPAIEIRSVSGVPLGIAVRGYGMFLLLGVASGLLLAVLRARTHGVHVDHIYALAMWMFFGGIGGARLFYIVEYRDSFLTGSLTSTVMKMLDFTRGGLVVYGSIIGGTLAVLAFSRFRKISALRLCDVIIPSLFLGLFFGRLGCLMNGCCYGGQCEERDYALHFPPGSPVYIEQLESGQLLGIEFADASADTDGFPKTVAKVVAESPAAQRGVQPGDTVEEVRVTTPPPELIDPRTPADDSSVMGVGATVNGRPLVWTADELPGQALPVLPAQVISSLTGLVICILLLLISRFAPLPTGVLAAIGFAAYAIARFGMEMIRTDEPGQFGTPFSISQLVSLLVLPAAIVAIIYIYLYRPADGSETSTAIPGTGQEN